MSALIQQTDEWLEFRRSKIGASDACVIMGVSPWLTPYKLWQEKLKLVEPRKRSKAMQNGLDKENEARNLFCALTGVPVSDKIVLHPSYEFMMASLDGISEDGKTIVEIKHVNSEDHCIAKHGCIPEKYFPQVQHQMEVCQLEKAYYFSYRHQEDFALVEIERDDKYIKKMIAQERQFYDYMQDFVAPPLTERDYETRNDDIWKIAALEWLEISTTLRDLELKEEALRQNLIALSLNKPSIGHGLKVSKIVRKGPVEYGKIPQLKGIDLEQYRKAPSEFWRVDTI